MNRDEFEKAYADKYLKNDVERSSHDPLQPIIDNRDGEGYADHHIDLCWKVQQVKNKSLIGFISDSELINDIEW